VLNDNFIARIYTSYQSEYHFLALYTILNCYVFIMAYMYAPSSASSLPRSSHQLVRDNPAFSMLNESDDDKEEMEDDEEELHAETDAMLPQRDREAERANTNSQSSRMITSGGLPLLGHDDSD